MDDVDLRHKSILLRVDLNSAIINGKVELSDRLVEHSKTIKELIKKKARVVVLAHQGRKGGDDFISLRQHAKLLNKYVGIGFVDDVYGSKAIDAINKLGYGQALLLENVRYLEEEEDSSKSNKFVNTLSRYFDYYVNDAFSVSHRDQASVTGFPKVLPGLIGRVMQAEIEGADKIRLEDVLFVLGGNKPEEHINLIRSKKNARILSCGMFGQACLIAKGRNLGRQNNVLEEKKIRVDNALIRRYNVDTPIDFAVDVNGIRREISLEELPSKYEMFDIGRKTVELYSSMIRKASVVLMKGPAGRYEDRRFIYGTKMLLDAIVNSNAYTIIAGGNTLSAMKYLNISKDKVSHVSLAGGAFIEYIAGRKLPGLEILKKR